MFGEAYLLGVRGTARSSIRLVERAWVFNWSSSRVLVLDVQGEAVLTGVRGTALSSIRLVQSAFECASNLHSMLKGYFVSGRN